MYVLIFSEKNAIPFYWDGNQWVHDLAKAERYPSFEEAQVVRWSTAGTDAAIGRLA